jgi:hypothetical protein
VLFESIRQFDISHSLSLAFKKVLARSARRVSNGDQVGRVAALAMKRGKSLDRLLAKA